MRNAFKRIDDERTELLIFVPMKLEILVQIRPKYVAACECCEKRKHVRGAADPPDRQELRDDVARFGKERFRSSRIIFR